MPPSPSEYARVIKHFRSDAIKLESGTREALRKQYTAFRGSLYKEIRSITDQPNWETESNEAKVRRMKDLLRHAQDEINVLAEMERRQIEDGVNKIIPVGERQALGLMKKSAEPLDTTFNRIPSDATELLAAQTQPGTPLSNILNRKSQKLGEALKKTLATGLMGGTGTRQLARDVAKQVDLASWRAEQITRNALLDAHRGAALRTYAANDDILYGWIWLAALSDRTCLTCLSMHQRKFFHEAQFMPRHVSCRCTPIPWMKDDMLIGTWAEDGENWLRQQPLDVQKKMMPKSLWDDWSTGELVLDDFIEVQENTTWGTSVSQGTIAQVLKNRDNRLSGIKRPPLHGTTPPPSKPPPLPPKPLPPPVPPPTPPLPPPPTLVPERVKKAQDTYNQAKKGDVIKIDKILDGVVPFNGESLLDIYNEGEHLEILRTLQPYVDPFGKNTSKGIAAFQEALGGVKYSKIEAVPVDAKISSIQDRVFYDPLKTYVDGWNEVRDVPRRPPVLYRYQSEYFVYDGNHRTAAARIVGDPTFEARVIDIDEIIRDFSPPPPSVLPLPPPPTKLDPDVEKFFKNHKVKTENEPNAQLIRRMYKTGPESFTEVGDMIEVVEQAHTDTLDDIAQSLELLARGGADLDFGLRLSPQSGLFDYEAYYSSTLRKQVYSLEIDTDIAGKWPKFGPTFDMADVHEYNPTQYLINREVGKIARQKSWDLLSKTNKPPDLYTPELGAKVSRYSTNSDRFIAEVYAHTSLGRQLPDDVMDAYEKMGGPKIPRVANLGQFDVKTPLPPTKLDPSKLVVDPSLDSDVADFFSTFKPRQAEEASAEALKRIYRSGIKNISSHEALSKTIESVDAVALNKLADTLEDLRASGENMDIDLILRPGSGVFEGGKRYINGNERRYTVELDPTQLDRWPPEQKYYKPSEYDEFDPAQYIVTHEFGHISYNRLIDPLKSWDQPPNVFTEELGKKVSTYAWNQSEFIAEVYAMKSLGKQLPQEVLDAYHKMKGPAFRPIKNIKPPASIKPSKVVGTLEEAEEFVKDSAIKDTLYHITRKETTPLIKKNGFRVGTGESGLGFDHGAGVYFSPTEEGLSHYEHILGALGDIEQLNVKVNVRKVFDEDKYYREFLNKHGLQDPYLSQEAAEAYSKKLMEEGYDAVSALAMTADEAGSLEDIRELVILDPRNIMIIDEAIPPSPIVKKFSEADLIKEQEDLTAVVDSYADDVRAIQSQVGSGKITNTQADVQAKELADRHRAAVARVEEISKQRAEILEEQIRDLRKQTPDTNDLGLIDAAILTAKHEKEIAERQKQIYNLTLDPLKQRFLKDPNALTINEKELVVNLLNDVGKLDKKLEDLELVSKFTLQGKRSVNPKILEEVDLARLNRVKDPQELAKIGKRVIDDLFNTGGKARPYAELNAELKLVKKELKAAPDDFTRAQFNAIHNKARKIEIEMQYRKIDLDLEVERLEAALQIAPTTSGAQKIAEELDSIRAELKKIGVFPNSTIGMEKTPTNWALDLKSQLAEYRDFGSTTHHKLKFTSDRYAPQGFEEDITRFIERLASRFFPSDWWDNSVSFKNGQTLTVEHGPRGWFDPSTNTIRLSGSSTYMNDVLVHELMHRMEQTYKPLPAAEELFYQYRTKGETLRPLPGYKDQSEMYKPDKFVHEYMGKSYGGGMYELMTEGVESISNSQIKEIYDKDPEYVEWLVGVLLTQ